ncbi:hypothetical protein [Aquabacterium sp.]|nr:hypothetical protein [Aquabacterium sp.]
MVERIVQAVQRGEDRVFVGPMAKALYNAKPYPAKRSAGPR